MTVSTLDVVELEEAKQLMSLAESEAPLAGIFQLAMMLDDRLIAQQVQHTTALLHLVYSLRCTPSSLWPGGHADARKAGTLRLSDAE